MRKIENIFFSLTIMKHLNFLQKKLKYNWKQLYLGKKLKIVINHMVIVSPLMNFCPLLTKFWNI
jgi:hypothetical protein